MNVLLLRFDGLLMSFGGVMVDHHGPTERFPGLSLLTGLFANALGYRHTDFEPIERLQSRIEFAARWDIEPEPIEDYHTVDLGRPKMIGYADIRKKAEHGGWTTHGLPEHRAGGDDARYGTHIRRRHYWADGVMTVATALLGHEKPDTFDLETAINRPARPLSLGRKACLPSGPILIGRIEAQDVLLALRLAPRCTRTGRTSVRPEMEACWPARLGVEKGARIVAVYDRRDWRNQVHTGSRLRAEGPIREEET
jgi:CRISPR system Cascade subunit CasD